MLNARVDINTIPDRMGKSFPPIPEGRSMQVFPPNRGGRGRGGVVSFRNGSRGNLLNVN